MDIQVLRPSAMPPPMADRWRRLQSREIRLRSPFLSPDWALAVESALGGAGAQIKVAVATREGEPRAFLPARIRSFRAIPVGAPLNDCQAIVAEPDFEADPRALVKALGVGRFDFTHMLAGQSGLAPYARGDCASWIVDLSAGRQAYVDQRKAAGVSLFKDIAKKGRRAEREAGPIGFTSLSTNAGDFDTLFAWKRAQLKATGQPDIFAPDWSMRLMRELFAGGNSALRGALFTLHIGGDLAAAQFHLLAEPIVHAWMIAHDPRFEAYSPGMILFERVLEWMDGHGYCRLDLGPGDYRFKRQFANVQEPLLHGFIGVPSAAATARGAAYAVRKVVEGLPLGPARDWPGKAMRRLDIAGALR